MEVNIFELFDSLYKRHYKAINGYFVKRFDKNESEDLTQQTFMKLWAYLPVVNAIEDEKALIFSVAKTVLYDRLRQKAVTATYITPEMSYIADNKNIYDELEWNLLLNVLSAEDREIFEMHLYGFKSREIGEAFGIGASTIRSRLAKIKKALRKRV